MLEQYIASRDAGLRVVTQRNPEVCIVQFEPANLDEAINGENSAHWIAAINEEIKALKKNNTWTLVERTDDKPLDFQERI